MTAVSTARDASSRRRESSGPITVWMSSAKRVPSVMTAPGNRDVDAVFTDRLQSDLESRWFRVWRCLTFDERSCPPALGS